MFGYSYAPEIIPLIEGVDCLYHEATFLEEDLPRAKETFHSTAKQAAKIALDARVNKLVIGHYSARYDEIEPLLIEAKAIFPETILGDEGLVVSLIEK